MLNQLKTIIGENAQVAPSVPTPHYGLMSVKRGVYKYLLKEGSEEVVIGLNLAGMKLNKEQWEHILKQINPSEIEALNLSGNELQELRFSATFSNLKYLEVSDCEALRSIVFEGTMPHLERLVLQDNQLEELVLPTGFDVLEHLNIQGNKLEKLTFEGACPQLSFVDVSKNQLKKLSFSEGFDGLNYLYAYNNQLKKLEFGVDMPHLEIVNLQDNQLGDQIDDWLQRLPKKEEEKEKDNCVLYIHGNPLNTQMESNIKDRQDAFLFLKEYVTGRKDGVEDNEYKVMVVGNGSVGKSSLVDRLVYNSFTLNRASTHAIRFERYEQEGFPYVLNIWDFGGQELYHATHRLFLQSNCLYLICWDRTTEEKLKNGWIDVEIEGGIMDRKHPLSYWIHYVNYFGKGSPLIVTQTKAAEEMKIGPPNEASLRELYTGATEKFDTISIDSGIDDEFDNGFEVLKVKVRRAIRKMNRPNKSDATWLKIRQKIYERQEEIRRKDKQQEKTTHLKQMSYEAFAKMIREDFECTVTNPQHVLNWLKETGVVFHEEGLFGDQILIDQEWAIKAVYTIFKRDSKAYHKFIRQDGQFSGEDLNNIWEAKGYSVEEQQLFVRFMKTCELCFEIEDEEDRWKPFIERQFIAPQLLKDEKHLMVQDKEEEWLANATSNELLYAKFAFDYLHEGIIQSFIVKTHQLADRKDIWRNGILLKWNGESVIVEVLNSELYIKTTQASGGALLRKVKQILLEMFKDKAKVEYSVNGTDYFSPDKIEQRDRIFTEDGKGFPKELFYLFDREQAMVCEVSEEGKGKMSALPIINEKQQALEEVFNTKKVTEGKPKLVFFAAEADGQKSMYANILKEWDSIDKSSFENAFRENNTTILNVFDHIESNEPHLVHFSVHGIWSPEKKQAALILEGHDRHHDEYELWEDALYEELETMKADLQQFPSVFLFNACHSASIAQNISRLGVYCIGFSGKIRYDLARFFAANFYNQYKKTQGDVRKAFRSGRRAAIMNSKNKQKYREISKLYHNGQLIN